MIWFESVTIVHFTSRLNYHVYIKGYKNMQIEV